jgi:outer membrane protein assembly factor BamB
MRIVLFNAIAAILAVLPSLAFADEALSANQIRDQTRIETGVAVLLGCGNGEIAADLARDGRMVVQLLVSEKDVAGELKAIERRGMSGQATVDRLPGSGRLPYADHLVSVLVCDLDTLKNDAPRREEILRVLRPHGALYARHNGKWTTTVKPMPKDMDEWTHFYHGPDGNPVSQDEQVGMPTGLQWIAGVHTMGTLETTTYRLAGGRALYEWDGPVRDRNHPETYLICRDAFNGVVLWTKRTDQRPYKTRPLILADEHVFTYLDGVGPLVCLDAKTGYLVRTYDQGGRPGKKVAGNRADVNLAYHSGMLIQTAGNTAYALEAQTGKLLWKHVEPADRYVDYPTVATATGQVVFTSGLTGRDVGRYPGADAREIIAFDLKTGKPQWRREMDRELSQLCVADGGLFAFNLAGFIGRPRDLFLARLKPEDGSIVWKINPGAKGQFLDFAVIGGKIYVMSLGLKIYDAADGKEIASLNMPGNSRCEMSRATKNQLLMSFGNFIDLATEPLQLQRCEITRGSCGTGNTPGYGMLYYNPNRCQCFVSVRGYLAVSREKTAEPMADNLRLKSFKPAAKFTPPATWPAADDWPIYLGTPQRSSATPTPVPAQLKEHWKATIQSPTRSEGSPVAAELALSSHYNGPVTAPTIAGGRVFVAVPEHHRVEARDAKTGQRLWAFSAGGRIDTPPTLYGGLCLFGCRDGNVYALDAATGDLLWRFMAAPYGRQMIDHNQLESTWPLFGSIAVVEGIVLASAGRHPETNGGIHAYGLDPASGMQLWKRTIRHDREPGTLGGKIPDEGITTKRYGYNANTVLNELFVSDGKLASITGMILEPETGEIANRPWPKKVSGKPQGLPEHPMDFYLDLGFRPPYCNQQLENYSGPGADHGSWLFRLKKPKLEVHGELVAFNKERVAVIKVAGLEWGMWDITQDELPGLNEKVRQNSSHPPTWQVLRNQFKGMDVTAVLLAGDKLVIGLSSQRTASNPSQGEIRIYSAKDAAPLGEIALDSRIIQAGLAAAGGQLYVRAKTDRCAAWASEPARARVARQTCFRFLMNGRILQISLPDASRVRYHSGVRVCSQIFMRPHSSISGKCTPCSIAISFSSRNTLGSSRRATSTTFWIPRHKRCWAEPKRRSAASSSSLAGSSTRNSCPPPWNAAMPRGISNSRSMSP